MTGGARAGAGRERSVRRRGGRRTFALALALGLPLAGCGAARQDAREPSASFALAVSSVSFPARQTISRPALLRMVVRNRGARTVPAVAVTVDSLSYRSSYPELSSRQRPVWVVEHGPGKRARPPVETQEVSTPGSGQTAYVSTWSLGPLAAGASQTYTWVVTPVRSGTYTVHYTVAAGLAGKARTRAGGHTSGQLVAAIAGTPPKSYVDPATGRVVVGETPPLP